MYMFEHGIQCPQGDTTWKSNDCANHTYFIRACAFITMKAKTKNDCCCKNRWCNNWIWKSNTN